MGAVERWEVRRREDEAEYQYPLLVALARKCEPFFTRHGITEVREGPAVLSLVVEKGQYAYGIDIEDGLCARLALAAPFERYELFTQSGYRAMWSPSLRTVECEVRPNHIFSGEWDNASLRGKDWVAQRVLEDLGLRLDPAVRVEQEQGPDPDPYSYPDTASYNKEMHARSLRRREALEKDLEEEELDPNVRIKLEASGGSTLVQNGEELCASVEM